MRRRDLVRAAALVTVAALSACKREQSFDERYASAEKTIRQKASEIDKDMAQRAALARQIAPESSAQASEAPPPSGAI